MNANTPADQRQATEAEVGQFSNFTVIHPEIVGIILVNENDMDISNEMYRVSRDPLTDEDWYKEAMAHRVDQQTNRSKYHHQDQLQIRRCALFFTRSIMRPISKPRKLMKQAEAGDLTVQIESAFDGRSIRPQF